MKAARVALPIPLEGPYTYAIPEGMALEVGHSVRVPVRGRQVVGAVVELLAESDHPDPRPIAELVDPDPVLVAEELAFLRWSADYYLAGLGEMIATALPAPYHARSHRIWTATPAGVERLAEPAGLSLEQASVLREVVARPGRSRSGLCRALQGELQEEQVDAALSALHHRGLVAHAEKAPERPGAQVDWVELLGPPEALPPQKGARVRELLAALAEAGGRAELSRLAEQLGPEIRSQVNQLVKKGLLRRFQVEDRRGVLGPAAQRSQPLPANTDQQRVLDALAQASAGTFLLHGVTGAGKTEVYLQAAARVLAEGRQVLVLVPEIALTPQLVERLRGRFGDEVAVLHSGLSPLERLREWRRIRAGLATVAVGARSALFAPFPCLGLIIVDEEHDDSYKQGEGVRYHARDLAVLRGRQAQCPVVLGSATPSLETWQNAQEGRYQLLSLPRRATPRPVPHIELINMCGRPGGVALSAELVRALQETMDQGGKAIVLYNRRGYAPIVECSGCGGRYDCPSCGVSLVLHQKARRLSCHYCGFYRLYEPRCAHCGSDLEIAGFGTERVEEELDAAFPGAGIVRMDADSTRRKGAHAELLDEFRDGKARLLVGTQVVAKGHDFPDVHMAAVVGVDHLLGLPDFRAAERTWALVTQLAGRAGRGTVAGRVLVQTRHVDHFVFRHLDEVRGPDAHVAFYAEEARLRRLMQHPPYVRLVLLRVESAELPAAQARAAELVAALRRSAAPLGEGLTITGPLSAPLSRMVGRWRLQIVIRGGLGAAFRRWLTDQRALLRGASSGGVRVIVDVDPRDLL